jgi:hypothetical protein
VASLRAVKKAEGLAGQTRQKRPKGLAGGANKDGKGVKKCGFGKKRFLAYICVASANSDFGEREFLMV